MLSRDSWLCSGFGILWGIQLTLLFSRSLFSESVVRGADGFNYAFGLGIAGACLGMFLFGRMQMREDGNDDFGPAALWGYGIAIALGSVVAVLSAGQHLDALRLLAGLICGAGLGSGYVLWMSIFSSRLSGETLLRNLTTSLALGLLLFAIMAGMHYLVRAALLCSCSLLSSAMGVFLVKRREAMQEESAVNPQVARLDSMMTYFAVFGIAMIYGMSGHVSLNAASPLQENTMLWHFVLAAISVALLAFLGRFLPRKATVMLLFRVLFPLVVVALVLLPFCGGFYPDVYGFVIGEAYQLMEVLLFFSFVTMTFGGLRLEIVCFSLAAMWIGTTTGVCAGAVVFGLPIGWVEKLTILAMIEFFLLSMMLYVLNILVERRAAASMLACRKTDANSVSSDEQVVHRACVVIAEECGLTKRESEILELLSRGRSGTFIAERLYLSPNTVKSYTRDVYAKIGVHSKQELIDRVEGACCLSR